MDPDPGLYWRYLKQGFGAGSASNCFCLDPNWWQASQKIVHFDINPFLHQKENHPVPGNQHSVSARGRGPGALPDGLSDYVPVPGAAHLRQGQAGGHHRPGEHVLGTGRTDTCVKWRKDGGGGDVGGKPAPFLGKELKLERWGEKIKRIWKGEK